MNSNKVEELISILNTNKIQCPKCKKWVTKEETVTYGPIGFKDYCIPCWFMLEWKENTK